MESKEAPDILPLSSSFSNSRSCPDPIVPRELDGWDGEMSDSSSGFVMGTPSSKGRLYTGRVDKDRLEDFLLMSAGGRLSLLVGVPGGSGGADS